MTIEIILTPAQEAFLRQIVSSGRYRTAEDAIRDAMARWEQDERARLDMRAALDEAEADLEAGLFTDYTSATISRLAEELKRGESRSRHMREAMVTGNARSGESAS